MNIPAYIITIKPISKIKKTIENVKRLGFDDIRIINGVIGKKLTKKELENLLTPRALEELLHGRKLDEAISGLGSVGCYLSHIKAIKEAVSTDIAIFEDDFVSFDVDPSTVLKSYNAAKKKKFDLLRIGYFDLDGEIVCKNDYVGAQAYIITPKGSEKILQHAFPIDTHIDWLMIFMKHCNFKMIYGKNIYNYDTHGHNEIKHSST